MRKNETCNRIWITYERGLSFEDMKAQIPNVKPSHGVYGAHNDITKLSVMKNFYKQDVIAEIYFDEEEANFLFNNGLDHEICTYLGVTYRTYMVNLGYEMDMNPNHSFDHMILSLTSDITEKFLNQKENTKQK